MLRHPVLLHTASNEALQQAAIGQVAAVLRKYGAEVDLGSPQLIDVSNILEVVEDSVRLALSLAQGTRFRYYVAVTG
jgi:hypothetical protein